MFTRLDEMREGDFFYIEVMGETLGYEVDRIDVIEPSETSRLRVVKGEDRVTLMTCTPYGVNTHRLLVSGHRVKIDPCTPLLRRKSRSGMSLQHKVAVRPRIESGKRRQQTAFARTGRADQIHYLTWCDRQRDILENRASLAVYHNLTGHIRCRKHMLHKGTIPRLPSR